MPYKILTLLIFIILFPALIAGSMVLLLKSGLVNTSKPVELSTSTTNKVSYAEYQPVETIHIIGTEDTLYYTGKIDGKIPFRLVLDSPEASYNPLIRGKLIYDGENEYALNTIAEFIPSNNKCERFNCGMEIKVFDPKLTNPNNDDGKLLSTFTAQINLLEKPSKITGTWAKTGSNKKLNFELNISEGFEIEDYKVLSFQNPDKTLEIIGNNCGIIGSRQIFSGYESRKISESSDLSDNCYLVAITSGKIKNATKILLRGCDKKSTNSDCGKRYFTFGKKEGEIQYLFDNGFTQDACTKGGDFYVLKYDMNSGKISKVGFFEYNICTSPIDEKSNQDYLNAKEKYSLPKP